MLKRMLSVISSWSAKTSVRARSYFSAQIGAAAHDVVELSRYPYPIAAFADAALNHITDAKFLRDLT
jgi:hypothetical protein